MRRRVLTQWLQGQELKEWVRRSTAAALVRVSIQSAGYLACVALALAPLPYALNLLFGVLAGHAIAILFSRTDEQCARSIAEHDKLLARTDGVRSVSYLDLNASPPFNYAHDHVGFRDRLSQPA